MLAVLGRHLDSRAPVANVENAQRVEALPLAHSMHATHGSCCEFGELGGVAAPRDFVLNAVVRSAMPKSEKIDWSQRPVEYS